MSAENKKYRNTKYGKEQTRKQRRTCANNHEDDEEYRNHMNMKRRERYQKRKIGKELLQKDISLGEKQESLGEIVEWNFFYKKLIEFLKQIRFDKRM